MIKHIVMWKLADQAENNDKAANGQLIKQKLEALKADISEIKTIEVGLNFNPSEAAYDVALYSEFNSKEDLAAYQVHPKHKEAGAFVGKVTTDRVVVDYEL